VFIAGMALSAGLVAVGVMVPAEPFSTHVFLRRTSWPTLPDVA